MSAACATPQAIAPSEDPGREQSTHDPLSVSSRKSILADDKSSRGEEPGGGNEPSDVPGAKQRRPSKGSEPAAGANESPSSCSSLHAEPPAQGESSFLEGGTRDDSCRSGSSRTKPSAAQTQTQHFCSEMLRVGVCQTDFAEQMDIFMRCQHPLDILGMFQDEDDDKTDSINASEHHNGEGGKVVVASAPRANKTSGYHAIPRSCEYCGSPDIDLCEDYSHNTCERPKSFFPREMPPFFRKSCGTKLPWGGGGGGDDEKENRFGTVFGVAVAVDPAGKTGDAEAEDVGGAGPARMACSAWV